MRKIVVAPAVGLAVILLAVTWRIASKHEAASPAEPAPVSGAVTPSRAATSAPPESASSVTPTARPAAAAGSSRSAVALDSNRTAPAVPSIGEPPADASVRLETPSSAAPASPEVSPTPLIETASREPPPGTADVPPPALVVEQPAPVLPSLSASPREVAAVQRVLDRYRQMYGQLDASSAAAFWPQADERALTRVFARLVHQELSFDECVIALSDASATAECDGWLRYVPRVGSSTLRSERHAWTIQLQRGAEAWTIVRVNAR